MEQNFMGMNDMYQDMYKQNCNMENMPPYMYGKCMNMPCCNGYMMQYNMPNYSSRSDMYMNSYGMQMMEPLENMCGKTYKILIVCVRKTVQKIMMENMGMMPKCISKEMFNKHLNDTMCEVVKQEDEIKKCVVVDRTETEEKEDISRGFCPYCNGMLKDVVTILLINELIRGGCTNCY